MNDLCTDIGWVSLNKYGQQLCGDRVEIVQSQKNSMIAVMADGLGSGVKANILSTLTAKIISTMMAEGMSIQDCVATVAATLPISSVSGIAYSTFTIIRITDNEEAEIIQYDSPSIILLRDGVNRELPVTQMNIGGKEIFSSHIAMRENDTLIAFSDGILHAGTRNILNYNWDRKDIIDYMEALAPCGYPSKTLAILLSQECNRLYGGKPSDDATVLIARARKREPINLVVGPAWDKADDRKMMSLFFSKEGKHIVCGGTTSVIAAGFLNKKMVSTTDSYDPKIPPISTVEGIDLVTEGVITMSRVLEYAKDYAEEGKLFAQWSGSQDGASKISRLLLEESTDINFFVGKAVNPAHQNSDLSITFNAKMQIVEELALCLKTIGKNVKIAYF